MQLKITKIEETPFGNREPKIDRMTFQPVIPPDFEGVPAVQQLEAFRCSSQDAPMVGDLFELLRSEELNSMRLENLALRGQVEYLVKTNKELQAQLAPPSTTAAS